METLVNKPVWYVAAEIDLVYKSKVKTSERPQIKIGKDAYDLFLSTWDENKIGFIEQFKVMLLNRANKVLGIYEVSTGGVSQTVADPKLIFSAALKANASAIILSHNHPSGSVQPSKTDVDMTKKMIQAGFLLDILVIDHIIITNDEYFSFANEGLL